MVADIQYTQIDHYYDQACRWLRIKHIVYNQEDKNIMRDPYST